MRGVYVEGCFNLGFFTRVGLYVFQVDVLFPLSFCIEDVECVFGNT